MGLFDNVFKREGANFYDQLTGAAGEAAVSALEGKIPATSKQGHAIATFAGGCFWGLELAFQRVPGVIDTSVGYTQGDVERPTYSEACSGSTGHTEAVQVFYDPKEVGYRSLLETFFGRTNPTTVNGQGNDFGTQYRTGVYTHTPEQKAEATAFMAELASKYDRPIATELKDAMIYWPAELYHQQYLSKGGRNGNAQSAEKGSTEPIRCYG
jgi:peptide-methionine (S)-S-oxide reductase